MRRSSGRQIDRTAFKGSCVGVAELRIVGSKRPYDVTHRRLRWIGRLRGAGRGDHVAAPQAVEERMHSAHQALVVGGQAARDDRVFVIRAGRHRRLGTCGRRPSGAGRDSSRRRALHVANGCPGFPDSRHDRDHWSVLQT